MSLQHFKFVIFFSNVAMADDFELPEGAGMMENENFGDTVFKVGEEKEIGKQGLKKLLVKEGEGWETAETGDEVEGILTHDL